MQNVAAYLGIGRSSTLNYSMINFESVQDDKEIEESNFATEKINLRVRLPFYALCPKQEKDIETITVKQG